MTIVINTPNGNIGRRTAERLLDSGVSVRIISRNPNKVTDLTSRGASLVIGSTDDAVALEKAFDGAQTVFWLTPPAYRPDYPAWVRETAEKAAQAMASAKVERRGQHLEPRRARGRWHRSHRISGRGRKHFERGDAERGAFTTGLVHGEPPRRRRHDRIRRLDILTLAEKRPYGHDRDE